ncbi:hypothetical protein [Actinoplanes auranticolor]|uniref:Uncharacterized protein n=1 Tax=Actinoplanes auranticolor TaxID=47988 RepID=A0A919VPE0_9ACTN|nr:hypothetical protein [Actinoplanes auranticolor]GIM73734.1 hypothetical protein Aau02nite_57410 [Actinoplanes auranticolor]
MLVLTRRWWFWGWLVAGLLVWAGLPHNGAAGMVWTGHALLAGGCAVAAVIAFLFAMSLWRTAGPVYGALLMVMAVAALGLVAYDDRRDIDFRATAETTASSTCMEVPYGSSVEGGTSSSYGYRCISHPQGSGADLRTSFALQDQCKRSREVAPAAAFPQPCTETTLTVNTTRWEMYGLNPQAQSVWASALGMVAGLLAGASSATWSRFRRRRTDSGATSQTIADEPDMGHATLQRPGNLRAGAGAGTWTRSSNSIIAPAPSPVPDTHFAGHDVNVALVPEPIPRWRRWLRVGGIVWPAGAGLGWTLLFVNVATPSELVAGSLPLSGLLVGASAAAVIGMVRWIRIRHGWLKAVALAAILLAEMVMAMAIVKPSVGGLLNLILPGAALGAVTELVWITIWGAARLGAIIWEVATGTTRDRSAAGRWAWGISCLAVAVVGGDTAHRAGFAQVWLPDLDHAPSGRKKVAMATGQLTAAVKIRFSTWFELLQDSANRLLRGNRAVGAAAALASTGMAVDQIAAASGVTGRVVAAVLAAGMLAASTTKLAQVTFTSRGKSRS